MLQPFVFLPSVAGFTLSCLCAHSLRAQPSTGAGVSPAAVADQSSFDGTDQLANTVFVVLRTPLALDCPSARQLHDRLQADLPVKTGPPTAQHVELHFSRDSSRYEVTLTAHGWRSGKRTFAGEGDTCLTLTKAALLALSILLDPEAEAGSEPTLGSNDGAREAAASEPTTAGSVGRLPDVSEPEGSVKPTPQQPRPRESPPRPVGRSPVPVPGPSAPSVPSVPSASARERWLEAAAAMGLGLGFTQSPVLAAELGVRADLLRVKWSALGFSTAPDTTQGAAGSRTLLLFGGHLRACTGGAGWLSAPVEVNPCLQVTLASLRGSASGYTTVTPARYRPWVALGPAVELIGSYGERLGWTLTAAVPFPLTRESYVIAGEDGVQAQVYSTPVWALWCGVGLRLKIL